MEPKILRSKTVKELFTPEGCHISEIWNSSQDENVSVARARVEPGVTTALHYLEKVVERYVITAGKGRVEVGELPATEVSVGDVVVIPAGTPQRIKTRGQVCS
jgi:mannose-6-phosphate isomerase-like protein (cupin superfamily)